MKAKTAVLGIGNPIMTDEGIGVVLVQRLQSLADKYPEIDFIEAGTGGMKLLHIMEGRERAIFIDCAFMKTEPGTIRRFTYDEVISTKELPDLSLHEGDLLQFLRMAKELNMCADEVIIFGIEPDRMGPGHNLTETITKRLDTYLQTIEAELAAIQAA